MSIENVEPQQWIVTEQSSGSEVFLTVCPNFLAVENWLTSQHGKWAIAACTNSKEVYFTGEKNLRAVFRKWMFRYSDGTVRQARGLLGFMYEWSEDD